MGCAPGGIINKLSGNLFERPNGSFSLLPTPCNKIMGLELVDLSKGCFNKKDKANPSFTGNTSESVCNDMTLIYQIDLKPSHRIPTRNANILIG